MNSLFFILSILSILSHLFFDYYMYLILYKRELKSYTGFKALFVYINRYLNTKGESAYPAFPLIGFFLSFILIWFFLFLAVG